MSGLDAERIAETVITFLETKLPMFVDAINEENEEDFELEDITSFHITDLGSIPVLPAIFVLCTSADVLSEMPSYTQAAYNVTIAVMVKDADEVRLKKKLYRYINAIYSVCKAAAYIGMAVSTERVEFSALYPEQQYISDARIMARLVVHDPSLLEL